MEVAKVVETPDEVHASHQRFRSAGQSAGTSHQVVHSLAEGGVEPFDEGGVDDTFSLLGCFDQAFHHFFAALHNAPVNGQHAFRSLFDDLNNSDVRPGNQFATTDSALSTGQFAAKSQSKGSDVTGQTIDGQ